MSANSHRRSLRPRNDAVLKARDGSRTSFRRRRRLHAAIRADQRPLRRRWQRSSRALLIAVRRFALPPAPCQPFEHHCPDLLVVEQADSWSRACRRSVQRGHLRRAPARAELALTAPRSRLNSSCTRLPWPTARYHLAVLVVLPANDIALATSIDRTGHLSGSRLLWVPAVGRQRREAADHARSSRC